MFGRRNARRAIKKNGVVSKSQVNDEVFLLDTFEFDTAELFGLDRARFISLTVICKGHEERDFLSFARISQLFQFVAEVMRLWRNR